MKTITYDFDEENSHDLKLEYYDCFNFYLNFWGVKNDSFHSRKSELEVMSACFGGFSVILVFILIGMLRFAYTK